MDGTQVSESAARVAVVGAGSIGGVIAAMLIRQGVGVRLVCRREEQAQLIRSEGLELTGRLGSFRVRVPAVSTIEALEGTQDIVFLATKAQDMLEPARKLLPFLTPESAVVSLQNGVSVDPLAELVGSNRTIGCVVGWGASMESDAKVRVTSRGSFKIGRLDATRDDRLERVCRLLSLVLPTRITDNIYGALYSKLMINACINSVGAITGLPLGKMLVLREAPPVFQRILAEAATVAEAAGIVVEPYSGQFSLYRIFSLGGRFAVPLRWAIALLVRSLGYGGVRSSTLQSLDRGRSTEIDWLNGRIVDLGSRHGVETPVNRRIVEIVQEIEQGKRQISVRNLEEVLRVT